VVNGVSCGCKVVTLPYIDANSRKSNLSVIQPFGVTVGCGIYSHLTVTERLLLVSRSEVQPFTTPASDKLQDAIPWGVRATADDLVEI